MRPRPFDRITVELPVEVWEVVARLAEEGIRCGGNVSEMEHLISARRAIRAATKTGEWS